VLGTRVLALDKRAADPQGTGRIGATVTFDLTLDRKTRGVVPPELAGLSEDPGG
jgi:NitT/TauT family transport system ATP-binding protein